MGSKRAIIRRNRSMAMMAMPCACRRWSSLVFNTEMLSSFQIRGCCPVTCPGLSSGAFFWRVEHLRQPLITAQTVCVVMGNRHHGDFFRLILIRKPADLIGALFG